MNEIRSEETPDGNQLPSMEAPNETKKNDPEVLAEIDDQKEENKFSVKLRSGNELYEVGGLILSLKGPVIERIKNCLDQGMSARGVAENVKNMTVLMQTGEIKGVFYVILASKEGSSEIEGPVEVGPSMIEITNGVLEKGMSLGKTVAEIEEKKRELAMEHIQKLLREGVPAKDVANIKGVVEGVGGEEMLAVEGNDEVLAVVREDMEIGDEEEGKEKHFAITLVNKDKLYEISDKVDAKADIIRFIEECFGEGIPAEKIRDRAEDLLGEYYTSSIL
jgi:hypothetical protein